MIKIWIISKTISITISIIILSIITGRNKMDNKKETAPYVKPGYKTTEFWAMIISGLFGVMLLFGVITNTTSNNILAYINNIAGAIITGGSVITYIWSRGKAKVNPNIDYVKLLADIKAVVDESKQSDTYS